MSYYLLSADFDRALTAFNASRGFPIEVLWNRSIGRWVVVQRTLLPLETHEMLFSCPGVTFPMTKHEFLFICSDAKTGMLKEPGAWLFREIDQRAHRNDDKKYKEAMFAKMRNADDRRHRLLVHHGQHAPPCSECERALAEMLPWQKAVAEDLETDNRRYVEKDRKHVLIARK